MFRHLRHANRKTSASHAVRRSPLTVETLEERALPSILFHPGVSVSLNDHNPGKPRGTVLTNPQVELVFWGNAWNNGANQTLRTNVINAVDTILRSPYTNALGQYGIGTGVLAGAVTVGSSSPNANFTDANVRAMLSSNMGGTVAYNKSQLYVVITQPGSTDPTEGLLGNHSVASASGKGNFYYAWTENVGGTGALDDITVVFSHEYAEAVTDPDGSAYQVDPRNQVDSKGNINWNEICDGEAQNYTFRVDNYLLQSYYSQRDAAYVVPNGSVNNFLVSSSRILTLQGSFGGNNDFEVSRINNGVYAELNRSTAQFDPNALKGIIINGVRQDSISIEQTGSDTPVTVNTGDGSSGINISPGLKNLSNIQGSITINGTKGSNTLAVYDSSAPANANLTYTVTATSVSRSGAAAITFSGGATYNLYLFGSSGGDIYNVNNTQAGSATIIKGGSSGYSTFNVLGNAGQLTIDGNGNSGAVYVGNAGHLTNILQAVSLSNFRAHGADLFVSNAADPGNRNVTLSSTQLSFGGPALTFPAGSLNYFSLVGGIGTSTYTVTNTPDTTVSTDLVTLGSGDRVRVLANSSKLSITGQAANRVEVGNNGRLTNILHDVVVSNSATATDFVSDDSADPNNVTATITDSTVSYGNPNAVLRYSNASSLTLLAGPGGGTFNVVNTAAKGVTTLNGPSTSANFATTVQATTGALVVSTHGLFDTLQIGGAGDPLDRIQGPVTVDAKLTFGLQLDDSAAPTGHAYLLTSSSLRRDGVALINFAATARPGPNLTASGKGANTFTVQSVPANGASFMTHSGDVVTIGSTGNTLSNLGTISVLGPAALTLNDQGETAAQTYTFGRILYSQLTTTGTTINYNAASTLTLNAGNGGNTLNVPNTPSSTAVTINAGAGSDSIAIGNAANRLDDLHGSVSVNGQGNTTLTINDQGNPTPGKSYEVYADSVKRVLNYSAQTYDAVVHYANVGTVIVNGGTGNDVFSIYGTPAGTNVVVNGGAVDSDHTHYNGDEFVVGADANALAGPLTLHSAKAPYIASYLVYYDYLNTAAQTYTLTTNAVNRSGLAPVNFDNLSEVILYASRVGGNAINVVSLGAGGFDNLAACAGDTVTVGSGSSLAAVQGVVVVGASAPGQVNVLLDDSANATPPTGPIVFSNDPTYGEQINGLTASPVYLRSSADATLTATILAGAGDKTFNVQAATDGVSLTLDAGSGTNTLDYTGYAGNVLVDLPLGSATGFSSIANIENVKGASGGPAGSYNVLVGNGGNVLTGGTGRRNLLIAGSSASTLIGGDQEDLLIAGTTSYDQEAGLASLQAIMAYWSGTDDFATRVNNLANGIGVPLLDASTVQGNGGGNTLSGNGALALLYTDGLDTINGFDAAAQLLLIAP